MKRLIKAYRTWECFTREQALRAESVIAREGLEASALQMRDEADRLERKCLLVSLVRVNWPFKQYTLDN